MAEEPRHIILKRAGTRIAYLIRDDTTIHILGILHGALDIDEHLRKILQSYARDVGLTARYPDDTCILRRRKNPQVRRTLPEGGLTLPDLRRTSPQYEQAGWNAHKCPERAQAQGQCGSGLTVRMQWPRATGLKPVATCIGERGLKARGYVR